MLFIGGAIPANAAIRTGISEIVVSDTANAYESSLTLQLDAPVSSTAADQIKSTLKGALQTAQPNVAGPSGGAFLLCNQAHLFTDSDGTFSFQHACGGTTGPWGYLMSSGLCSIVTGNVAESGMAWTRNAATQPRQAAHPSEGCGYQYHSTYNPEHDFDSITYNDVLSFRVNVGGATGSATLDITGSFYSAKCTNPSVCP